MKILPRNVVINAAIVLLPLATAMKPSQYLSKIQLNAGVLHSPPMAIVNNTQSSFSGFQIDLLDRMKIFAAEDGIDLMVNLAHSQSLYADAFNLIANDCNTTSNPNPLENCLQYDMLVGDFYSNADRHMRADLSPPWMKTSLATIKSIDEESSSPDIATLSEAEEARATVCVPKGTYLSEFVRQMFPQASYLHCDQSADECTSWLRQGKCALFADDELLLHHQASDDPALFVSREPFSDQYLVWPMKEDLPRDVSKLMKKWMYQAVQNATVDRLYHQYFFSSEGCPIGRSGEKCDLPCDRVRGVDVGGVCVCNSAKFSGEDCSIEVQENTNMIPAHLVSVSFGLATVNFALAALCAAWVFRNRNRNHVQMAQPAFLLMILVGCVISTSSIFALAQQDEGHGPVPVCTVIPWLYSIGFSLSFGAMYARIRRIHHVMQCSVNLKRVTITARETVLTATLVLAIDVVILTVWSIKDPLVWQRTVTSTDVFGEPLESEGHCTSDHWRVFAGLIAVFHFILMAVALYKCYLARKIPERVSNCKYVAIATYSNFQVFLLSIPLLMMLGSGNPGITFFIRAIAIWINDFVVLSLIFGDLLYKVYRHDVQAELAVRRSKRSSHYKIKSDLRKYARAMRGFSSRLGMRDSMCATTGTHTTRDTHTTMQFPDHTSFRSHPHRQRPEKTPCPAEIIADIKACLDLDPSTLHDPTVFNEATSTIGGLTRNASFIGLGDMHLKGEKARLQMSEESLNDPSFHVDDNSTLPSNKGFLPDPQDEDGACPDEAESEDEFCHDDLENPKIQSSPEEPEAAGTNSSDIQGVLPGCNSDEGKHAVGQPLGLKPKSVQDLLNMFEGRIKDNGDSATVPSLFRQAVASNSSDDQQVHPSTEQGAGEAAGGTK